MGKRIATVLLEDADGKTSIVNEDSEVHKYRIANGWTEVSKPETETEQEPETNDEPEENDDAGEPEDDPEVSKETGKVENHVDGQGREEAPTAPASRDEMVAVIFDKTGEKPHHALGMAKVIALYEKAKAG